MTQLSSANHVAAGCKGCCAGSAKLIVEMCDEHFYEPAMINAIDSLGNWGRPRTQDIENQLVVEDSRPKPCAILPLFWGVREVTIGINAPRIYGTVPN